MSALQKLKRPHSHRWIIGIFVVIATGFGIMSMDIYSGRANGFSFPKLAILAFLSSGPIVLFMFFAGKQKKWSYYGISLILGLVALRGVYTASLRVYYFLKNGALGISPYFHLAERDKPFLERQQEPVFYPIVMPLFAIFLVFLFYRFAFGVPSKAYFGLPGPKDENNGGLTRR